MTKPRPHLLLIEDDEIDAEAVLRGLATAGLELPVAVARDGEEALELLRGEGGRPPLPRPYLILLDINLPVMGGFEFLDELRADPQHRDAVVFVLSTSPSESDRAAAYARNAAGYLVKSELGDHCVRLTRLLGAYLDAIELPT